MLDQDFIKKMQQRLLAEKKSVEKKLGELRRPEMPLDNPDEEDLAVDAAEDIIEESSRATFRQLLTRIEAALDRIDRGTYGIGIKTGKAIPREHLEREPWAEECAPIMQSQ